MAKQNETKPRRVDDFPEVARAQETLHRAKTLLGQAESELHASKAQTAGDVLAAIEAGEPVATAPDTAALRHRVATLREAEAAAAAKVAAARQRAEEAVLAERMGELTAADEAVGVALAALDAAVAGQRVARDAIVRAGVDWQRVARRAKRLRYLREDSLHLEATQWANGGRR